MTYLYIFLATYLLASIILSFVSSTSQGKRPYILHDFWGGVMIFLFGPVVALALLIFPKFRRDVQQAALEDEIADEVSQEIEKALGASRRFKVENRPHDPGGAAALTQEVQGRLECPTPQEEREGKAK